ncbi:MAG: TetR/AcrR family transcriptional regulator [Bacteroidia bacterium]|nr:TetR/AcrR family transcriptional regulator [Bacteroidia bacterium]
MNKKYRKEDVVALGAELIREKGYHATGINDILKEAGIPKGSFYNFFSTKEDFGREALQWYGHRLQRAMKGIFAQQQFTPLQRLKKFYGLLITGNAEEDFLQGCLVNNLSIEVAGGSDLLAAEADRQFNLWIDEVTACIEEGQELGEISDRFPADQLAEFLHTAFFGAFARMKASRDSQPLELVFTMMFSLLTP